MGWAPSEGDPQRTQWEKGEEKGRKSMQGELVSSVLLWAPGVQVLMGSPGKRRAVHTSESSYQGGEREASIIDS